MHICHLYACGVDLTHSYVSFICVYQKTDPTQMYVSFRRYISLSQGSLRRCTSLFVDVCFFHGVLFVDASLVSWTYVFFRRCMSLFVNVHVSFRRCMSLFVNVCLFHRVLFVDVRLFS